MKKVLVLATCLGLLLAGAAQADTLTLGSHYTNIAFIENKTMPDGFTTFDVPYELNTFADWGISSEDAMANMYIVYTFHIGGDPGMDFRCM